MKKYSNVDIVGSISISGSFTAPSDTLLQATASNAVSASYSDTSSFAASSSFAPTNIRYGVQVLPTINNIGGTIQDVDTFTLPVPGVYKITYIIRTLQSSVSSEPKIYLRFANNTEVPQSMLMPSYGIANVQAYGSQMVVVTTTVANQGMKVTAICGSTGTMNLLSDGNGFSRLIWEKIA
jgi:hypothetical protein